MRAAINYFRRGMIQIWYGGLTSLPAGWILCNGDNGTPDLRNRFVVGAGWSYATGTRAGTKNHTHVSDTTHYHNLASGTEIAKAAGTFDVYTDIPAKGSVTGAADHYPEFHALYYIMKI